MGVYEPESVADHSFRTAFLCMICADMQGLDTLKMLRMALIHDLPEAIIGDLMPSQKTPQTKQEEEIALHDILSLLPELQREKYLGVWKEYQQAETKEAKAVRQLDKVEMALQAKEYEKLGPENQSFKRFIKSAKDATDLPELKRLLCFVSEEQ